MRTATLAQCGLLALWLALVPAAGAAEQPTTVPEEFRNNQERGFGLIAMEPYLQAGEQSVPIEAHITLRDLATLERASRILFAFNTHSDDIRVDVGGVVAGGNRLEPVKSETIEGGLQQQRFYAPADLLAAANGGTVEVIVSGTATALANGQWHVGVLVIAFDAAWGTLRAVDGQSAELYGFTMVMATGVPSSAVAPFHGRGNTVAAVPLIGISLAAAVAGGWALAATIRAPSRPAVTARPPEGRPLPAVTLTPAAVATRPMEAPVATATPPAVPVAATVPVFGSVTSPPVAPTRAVYQGPKMPPGFAPPPWPTVLPMSDAPMTDRAEPAKRASKAGQAKAGGRPRATRASTLRSARRGGQPSR